VTPQNRLNWDALSCWISSEVILLNYLLTHFYIPLLIHARGLMTSRL
jgi:hypothetical protein